MIKNSDIETKLSDVMCTNPTTVTINDEDYLVLQIMKEKDLTAIPIIDDNRKIIDLHTMKDLIGDTKIENTVFLLAGGFGKRLGDLTSNAPIPLLNIGNKPIIETIIQQLIKHNFKKFIISSHYTYIFY